MAKNALDPRGEMRATPRKNALAGYAADAIRTVDNFARNPLGYSNPPAEIVSDFLSVPAIYRTLDRLAYGEPLTTGAGQATTLRPDTVDAAMALAPVVAKYPRQAAGAAMGLLSGGANGFADASALAQGASRMTREEMISSIQQAIKASGGKKVGLRVMPDDQGHLGVGDVAPNSWKWKNGDYTDKRLDGVSAASLGRGSTDDVGKAIKNLGLFENGPNGYYYGPKVAVIYADEAKRGADVGETVLKNGYIGWVADNPRWKR